MRASMASVRTLPRRLDPRAALRMFAAGSAWGIIMSTGFVGYALWNCRPVCPEDAVLTTATCIVAGILTIGPLAAFGRGSH